MKGKGAILVVLLMIAGGFNAAAGQTADSASSAAGIARSPASRLPVETAAASQQQAALDNVARAADAAGTTDDEAVPAADGAVGAAMTHPLSPEGAADGRIVVISNETHFSLAIGTFNTSLRPLPDPKLLVDGQPVGQMRNKAEIDITGQLVDGNYTEIWAGGLAAATRNHGVNHVVPQVHWSFSGEEREELPLGYRPPDEPNSTEINGTFFAKIIPDVSKAGLYAMSFWFLGADLSVSGTDYAVYPPCRVDFQVAIQFDVVMDVQVDPQPALAGSNISVSGNAKGVDTVPLDNEGLLVTFDGNRIGAPLPAGWYLDDVTVIADTLHTLIKENFETGGPGWSHGGSGDDWQVGVPETPIGPTAANSGQKCAGTNLRGSYEQLADCYLYSPDFNLSMAFSAQMSFYQWYDIAKEDSLYVSLEALINGVFIESDGIEINGSNPQWTQMTLDFTQFTHNGATFQAVGSEKVRLKFHLVSRTFSVYTKGGQYQFRWEIPLDTTEPGEHNVTVSHPGSLYYAQGGVSVVFPVRRGIDFKFSDSAAAHIAYRSSADNSIQKYIELKAKMVDEKGEPPLMQIKDEKGESIRQDYQVKVFWDATPLDPHDPMTTVGTARPVNMTDEKWDGSLTIAYKVPNEQALGQVNVQFSFAGTRYYAENDVEDHYNVMAHMIMDPPPIEQRFTYRGVDLDLYGKLKVKPEESQLDTVYGDPPLNLQNVRIFWAGTEQTSESKPVITDLDGSFSLKYHVGSTHPLGAVPVSYQYDGSALYQPCVVYMNYSVKSQTFIFFESQTVMKGTPIDVYIDNVKRLGIAGVLRDDKGDRIAGATIALKRQRLGTEETLKSNLLTGADGVFVFPFTVRFEDQVGNLTLIASFAGDEKYTGSTNTTNYTVRVRTTIERIDTQTEVTRGGTMDIQALLYEDWNGAPGYEIKYELLQISLDGQPITNNMTDNGGQVSFHSIISSKTQVGLLEIALDYNGSENYMASSNLSLIFVKGRTAMTFEDVLPNDTLWQKKRLGGRVHLVDDASVPLQNQTVTIFYTLERSAIDIENPEIEKDKRDKQVAIGQTDLAGYMSFNVTFTMGENKDDQQKWKVHLWARYAGQIELMPDGEMKLKYLNSTGEKAVDYIIPAKFKVPNWGWLIVLIIVAVGSVITGYAIYEIQKKRALRGMQTIIRRAADQLVAGNEYAAVIFKAYRKLANNMKRYGYMRRDSETFREFEKAIRIALPIDQKAMSDFLTVLEEARYSQHEMGEPDRDRAIQALRAVQYSLEKVILTAEQLALIQDKAEALPEEAEPEIFVQTADGSKTVMKGEVPVSQMQPTAPAVGQQARKPGEK
jgi:hypothetical protein